MRKNFFNLTFFKKAIKNSNLTIEAIAEKSKVCTLLLKNFLNGDQRYLYVNKLYDISKVLKIDCRLLLKK